MRVLVPALYVVFVWLVNDSKDEKERTELAEEWYLPVQTWMVV